MSFLSEFLYLYGSITNLVLLNCLLALSAYMNFSCGQFSVAAPGFMAIGAYSATLLTTQMQWPFAAVLLGGVIAAALVALLFGLPILKLKGVYLAMATLGFVQVVQNLAINLNITGGAIGLMGIPTKTETWHLALALAAFLYLLGVIARSRLGAGLRAIRQDWQLARVMGVHLDRYNIIAFVMAAAMAGLAGGLAAHANNAVVPGDFGFGLVVAVLSFAIVGGIDRAWGPILGALLLTILPEVSRPLQEYRLIATGLLLLIVILFLRRGLAGLVVDAWQVLRTTGNRWLFSK